MEPGEPMPSRPKEQAASPTGLIGKTGVVFLQVFFARGGRSVGSHDMSCCGCEIRGFKRTVTADPTTRTIDRQRPPVIDQLAEKRQLLAA